MIIWDCDPREVDGTQRRKSILLGMQMKFLKYAKGKGPILSVGYNQLPMDDESDQRPITLWFCLLLESMIDNWWVS
jgi:hypothetical protein